MKTKFLIFALLVLLLTACGKHQENPEICRFCVVGQEMEIALDAPAQPVLEQLGVPFGYAESKSSRYNGVEKTYHYQGLNLRTYPGNDCERILGVLLTGSGFQTQEGITLGDSAERVRECYGDDAIQNNCLVLNHSRETLTLLLQNNIVTAIQCTMV